LLFSILDLNLFLHFADAFAHQVGEPSLELIGEGSENSSSFQPR